MKKWLKQRRKGKVDYIPNKELEERRSTRQKENKKGEGWGKGLTDCGNKAFFKRGLRINCKK